MSFCKTPGIYLIGQIRRPAGRGHSIQHALESYIPESSIGLSFPNIITILEESMKTFLPNHPENKMPEWIMQNDPVALYEEYGAVIYGFTRVFTEDDRLAATLIADTIDHIHKSKEAFDASKMSFLTYIRNIVREKYLEAVNSPQFVTRSSIREESTFLQVAASISPFHREVFYERYYEGKPVSSIASQSDRPPAEIKSMLNEIALKLGEYL